MSEPLFEASEPINDPIGTSSFGTPVPRKQGFNIYTSMLIFSFVCLLLGTLLLLFELQSYGDFPSEWPWKTEAGRPNASWAIELLRFRG